MSGKWKQATFYDFAAHRKIRRQFFHFEPSSRYRWKIDVFIYLRGRSLSVIDIVELVDIERRPIKFTVLTAWLILISRSLFTIPTPRMHIYYRCKTTIQRESTRASHRSPFISLDRFASHSTRRILDLLPCPTRPNSNSYSKS